MPNKIQIKRGLKSKLPTLEDGEFGLCTDTKDVFVGNAGENIDVTKKTELDRKGNYEWGWWTPIIYTAQGTSYMITANTNGSYYYKINNIVRCFFKVYASNWNTDWGSYLLLIRGLPYNASKDKIENGVVCYYSGLKDGWATALGAYGHATAQNAFWLGRQTSTGSAGLTLSALNQEFMIQGWYEFSI